MRDCLYFQGPVTNPGQEVMIACGGRILSDTSLSVEDVLTEVLEERYKPKTAEAMRRLKKVFTLAEESYFSQWSADLFAKIWGTPVPGEFKRDQRLFGTCPGPATYLKEPCLDAKGRDEYRRGLMENLRELQKLNGSCRDRGRLARIQRGVVITLSLLNTVCYCLGEPIP